MSVRARQKSPLRSPAFAKPAEPGEGRSPALVCLGRIGAARGLKGEVRIRAFTARARDIAAYGSLTDASGARFFDVSVVSEIAGGVIARIAGIADRTAAEELTGTELFVPRRALPELPAGEFYHSDLIGLAAVDTDGRDIGRVGAIHDFGAGAILEIVVRSARASPRGGALWPASLIATVDLGKGHLVLERREEIVAASKGGSESR
ncbi:MAG: 16S rRNA processing protein RimM [Rhodospirillales bacterium]|nr:16S rRNA processing protein RimM [Rhodospirillales bacterium]MSP80131.1 16S rRNA processing protein RimM [Rhodospirillales bacterium]